MISKTKTNLFLNKISNEMLKYKLTPKKKLFSGSFVRLNNKLTINT